jgi:hypothetical protein
MKKFLVHFFYFSLVPFLLILLFEVVICFSHDEIFSEKKLEQQFSQEIADYEWVKTLKADSVILLAGSSSVRYSLSCSKLNELNQDRSDYINIAMDARDPIVTYFIIKNLGLKNISAIYFGLDPWIFAKQYYKHGNNYLYLDLNLIETSIYSLEHDHNALFERYKQYFIQFLNQKTTKVFKNYIVPSDFGSAPLNKIPLNFNNNPYELFQIKTYGWSNLQFEYLKKIVAYCKTNNIRFSMFVPPKRSDFTKSYQTDCLKIHEQYVNKLSQNGISADIFGQFDQLELFGDSLFFVEGFHLNERGQKTYTEIFYELSISPKVPFSKQYEWY